LVAAVQTGSGDGWLPLSSQELRQHQAADAVLGQVRGWLEEGRQPPWAEVSAAGPEVKAYHAQWGNLELHDGVAHRRWQAPGRGTELLQLLVPRLLRPQVLQLVHGTAGAGHFGNSKTLHRLHRLVAMDYFTKFTHCVNMLRTPSPVWVSAAVSGSAFSVT